MPYMPNTMQSMNIQNLQNHQNQQQQQQTPLVFQAPKFAPANAQIRQSELLNANEIFSDFYFSPENEQIPQIQGSHNSYFDSMDSEFLNLLCAAPDLSLSLSPPYIPPSYPPPSSSLSFSPSVSNSNMMPMRVQPLPRSTIPVNTSLSLSLSQGGDRERGYCGREREREDEEEDDDPNSKKRKHKMLEGREMTAQQKLERRERNREHAKRSRIRKKVLLDTLQDQLISLRGQNTKLRRIVAEKLPERASEILERCTTEESQLLVEEYENESQSERMEVTGTGKDEKEREREGEKKYEKEKERERRILMEPDFRLIGSLITSQQNFVVSDPSLPDNPIVYCSEGFCKLTGYKRSEVLGRNCRFLQGPETDQRAVDMIRQGIIDGRDVSVCLLNYKSDGSTFWNQFFVAALRGSDGQVVNYVGVQCEVNTLPVSQMKDRVKKLPLSLL
eukprot:CAMPEP_0182421260 /NCGR_PEP_ID=MMETSP1167-20130531/6573_1 /TAXON_ID=2988 /ORGANISM="Mallomonas Sp, Strain CCMP3275" /LENGTH=445 /DNA_ID=CAMNT_0024598213 /DNA_START=147 /DNA_END=1484 /DNA_ORIENTATION=-